MYFETNTVHDIHIGANKDHVQYSCSFGGFEVSFGSSLEFVNSF